MSSDYEFECYRLSSIINRVSYQHPKRQTGTRRFPFPTPSVFSNVSGPVRDARHTYAHAPYAPRQEASVPLFIYRQILVWREEEAAYTYRMKKCSVSRATLSAGTMNTLVELSF